jgi:hypothetical protein
MNEAEIILALASAVLVGFAFSSGRDVYRASKALQRIADSLEALEKIAKGDRS